MQGARDNFLAGPVLAGNQHIRVRRANAFDEFQDVLHRCRFRDNLRQFTWRIRDAVTQGEIFSFQPPAAAQGFCELDLRTEYGQQARVVPRFLNEVARPTPHRLDGQIHAAPGGHHDYRQRWIDFLNAGQEIETFTAGSGVTRIVEIDEDDVQLLRINCLEHPGR